MEEDAYLTIQEEGQGLYKEKGSKFFGFAFSVHQEEDVKRHIHILRKEHYDARHYCYAFVIGKDGKFFRAGDDGEPANSAGAPILGQIRSKNLKDVLVVVVRYFGGTKLGVPGLINAYKTAAAEALQASFTKKIFIKQKLTINFGYPDMNEVMRWVKDYDLEVLAQDFAMECKMEVAIREGKLKNFLNTVEKKHTISISNDA